MIDPKLFTVEKLLETLLDDMHGNVDVWRARAEIIVGYMPPYPSKLTRPATVVRYGNLFLRFSKGPRQGHTWGIYGDNYHTPELALIALLEAPVPPEALKSEVWSGETSQKEPGT